MRWQARTAGLLFHKASSVYHSLACTFNSNGKFGRGLKNCKLAFKCLEASQIFGVESENKKGKTQEILLDRFKSVTISQGWPDTALYKSKKGKNNFFIVHAIGIP